MARTGARAALVAAVVVLLDQVTKRLVEADVDVGSEDSVLPLVSLVHVQNRGVAFSFLEGRQGIVMVVVGLAMAGLLAWFASGAWRRPGVWVPVGLLLGGALGNVIDRLRQGLVTDFIKLPAWPAFNVADVAITFGVLALLYVTGREDDAADDPA